LKGVVRAAAFDGNEFKIRTYLRKCGQRGMERVTYICLFIINGIMKDME
jgi:hypothetical protein